MELSSCTEDPGLMTAQNFDDAFKLYRQNSYVFRDRRILVKFTYRAKIIYRSFVHRSTTISFLEQRKSEEILDST
jgi:hypothetical protein